MTYLKKQRAADLIFVVFTLSWIVSRIGLLPYRIIYYSSYLALLVVPMFPAYYIFNGLLCSLQVLHIIWTWFIVRIAIHAVQNNGVSSTLSPFKGHCQYFKLFEQIKDLRSDDESSDAIRGSSEDRELANNTNGKLLRNGIVKSDNLNRESKKAES